MAYFTRPLLYAFILSLVTRPFSNSDPIQPRGRSFGRMMQDSYLRSSNRNDDKPHSVSLAVSSPQQRLTVSTYNEGISSPFAHNRTIKTPFIADFEKYVSTIPISSFVGDALLMQFLDRLNGRTTYRHLDHSSIDRIVYDRSGIDEDSDVVILTAEQDKIGSSKHNVKRVYVVLRRALQLDLKLYYATYVYVTYVVSIFFSFRVTKSCKQIVIFGSVIHLREVEGFTTLEIAKFTLSGTSGTTEKKTTQPLSNWNTHLAVATQSSFLVLQMRPQTFRFRIKSLLGLLGLPDELVKNLILAQIEPLYI